MVLERRSKPRTVLPSGSTRGSLCEPQTDILHVDRGPRVEPEGSPVKGEGRYCPALKPKV
jgi:hypothetical protein